MTAPQLTGSERDWLRVRRYLSDRRHELAVAAGSEYPEAARMAGTPLLAALGWRPPAPVPLDGIGLEFRPGPAAARVTGAGEAALGVLPQRGDGRRYRRYSEALGTLAAPGIFEDRPTYRLLEADLTGPPGRLVFGRGSYFDGVDTGEAAAHEYAAASLGSGPDSRSAGTGPRAGAALGRGPAGECTGPAGLRGAIGDPRDLASRPVNLAISTLTLRHDRRSGGASMLLHWRDPAKVGHAGGLYQVIPVGVFQPSGSARWNELNDFSLWRCMLREYAEELAGQDEDHGSERAPISYATWPFGARMTRALDSGALRVFCLGLGTDPLTYATDLLTVAVFDAPVFDALFAGLRRDNTEGRLLTMGNPRPGAGPHAGADLPAHVPADPPGHAPADLPASAAHGLPFAAATVNRFAYQEPMQAAGAALLALAWQHRGILLG